MSEPLDAPAVQALMSDADQDALVAAIRTLDAALFQANTRLGEIVAERQARRAARGQTGTGQLVGQQGVKRRPGTGTLKLAAGQARPQKRPPTTPMAQGRTAPIGTGRKPAADPLASYGGPAQAGAIERLIAAVEAAETDIKATTIMNAPAHAAPAPD